ncbi:TVP38/TMEM64 family protein [Phormidium sp. LEGE 05292]|nr:TVP38/TMEM64 family protein [Phormidium sp. LEGE 05292]
MESMNMQEIVNNTLTWIAQQGPWGAIAFILIYNLTTVLFIPGSLLTLGGGVIFGVFWGSLYVFIAATMGATFAFLIGRYLTRDWVAKKIADRPQFQAIDNAVAKEGFKIVLLTRLSPVFPFNLLNYAFGITKVSLKDYILGSIGMIPGTIMYVYIGSLAGDIAMIGAGNVPTNPQAETAKWTIRIVGFIATVAVTIYITHLAKKALRESVN